MIHHELRKGYGIDLRVAPPRHVFKERTPFIILQRIFFHPADHFVNCLLIQFRFARFHLLQFQEQF